jgi:hypothetical protein
MDLAVTRISDDVFDTIFFHSFFHSYCCTSNSLRNSYVNWHVLNLSALTFVEKKLSKICLPLFCFNFFFEIHKPDKPMTIVSFCWKSVTNIFTRLCLSIADTNNNLFTVCVALELMMLFKAIVNKSSNAQCMLSSGNQIVGDLLYHRQNTLNTRHTVCIWCIRLLDWCLKRTFSKSILIKLFVTLSARDYKAWSISLWFILTDIWNAFSVSFMY